MGAHIDSTVQEYVPVRHCVFTSTSYNKHLWLYLHECIVPYNSWYYQDLNMDSSYRWWYKVTEEDVITLILQEMGYTSHITSN